MSQIDRHKTSGAPTKFRLGRHDAKLMGVCAGISNYFGWDVTLVRVAWVLAALFGIGAPFLIYLAIGLIAD